MSEITLKEIIAVLDAKFDYCHARTVISPFEDAFEDGNILKVQKYAHAALILHELKTEILNKAYDKSLANRQLKTDLKYKVNTILHTKDGREIGNAIVQRFIIKQILTP